ncbi:MAG TPA: hypothetical protein VNP72_00060 [Longimicrobium sp.]|nr:hypothetical protein [Longimicrobium sp.]
MHVCPQQWLMYTLEASSSSPGPHAVFSLLLANTVPFKPPTSPVSNDSTLRLSRSSFILRMGSVS